MQYRKDLCTCHSEYRYIVKRLPGRKYCMEGNKERLKEKRVEKKKSTGEKDLFGEIWEKREKVSFLSGYPLMEFAYSPFFLNCFAHVLAKGRYPKFRLKETNIILLTPDEHYMFDFGTVAQRKKYAEKMNCDWMKVYGLKDELLEEYEYVQSILN